MLRCIEESVRSRWSRLLTSVEASTSKSALLTSRLASAFSKRIGLTLCGMVARPHGALAADLREVAERDVGPDVGAEVVQHAVEPRDVGVELGLPVVRLDLGGERVPRQAEGLDEPAAQRRPVGAGHGGEVRAVRAGRAVELAEVLGRRRPGAAAGRAGGRARRAPCPSSSAWPAARGCATAAGRRAARSPSPRPASTSGSGARAARRR